MFNTDNLLPVKFDEICAADFLRKKSISPLKLKTKNLEEK